MMRIGWSVTVGMVLFGLSTGCNVLTGAGDLTLAPAAGSGDGGGGATGSGSSSSNASGTGTSSSSSASGGLGGGGGDGPVDTPMGYADGAFITDIDLYQAIRRPLVEDGSPASSSIPVVAGRTAMVRVFYETDGSYDGQTVTARLSVGESEPVEVQQVLGGASSHLDLNSTINFDVPGEILLPGSDYKIELLQPSASTSGNNSGAAFPSDGGTAPMEIEQGAVKLKIMLVPVRYNNSLPDTSEQQVALYHQYFSEQYPVPEVEITVRDSPYNYGGGLGTYNGWSNLLDQITDLRNTDNAPADVYYYGIHNASSSGLLGLGWIGGSNDVWSRTAIGVGWTGETAPETAVHELGHNHGRPHSPCGVSGDGNYPHSGARIGVWGYRPHDNKLLDPDDYVDFMSYCDPAWMSDHSFKKIFDRSKIVSAQPFAIVPEHLKNRVYDRIKIIDGVSYFKDTVTLEHPPAGEVVTLTADVGGQPQTLTGSYYAYDHVDGGVILVMRPASPTATLMQSATFTAAGQTLTATR